MEDKKSIVVIGGGTGTHTILRGLKHYQRQINLTAIVTMADSGGSTGRLRDEFGQLPVGDVRMALAALASDDDEHEELVRQLFMHRFDRGSGLEGHNVGNLLLVALTDILGSEEAAIRAAARVLHVRGSVIPVSTESVHLVATYADGVTITGEHKIDEPDADRADYPIVSLSVTPNATINPKAEAAILNADLIILGPGDLYASTVANLVVDGIPEAIQASKGKLIYVVNLFSKSGQTEGYTASKCVEEITRYAGRKPDYIIVNSGDIPQEALEYYASESECPIEDDLENSPAVIRADVVSTTMFDGDESDVLTRSLIRHDSQKLATLIETLL